ncbi:MAG TPA: hypothetical protein P5329_10725 [Candidatus Competibacteraceae bacterium]|nr:hypothetical protein [Candidatus Competibacteraceae bacterium]
MAKVLDRAISALMRVRKEPNIYSPMTSRIAHLAIIGVLTVGDVFVQPLERRNI